MKSELMGTGDARMPVQTSQVSKQTLLRAMARTGALHKVRWGSHQKAGTRAKGIAKESASSLQKYCRGCSHSRGIPRFPLNTAVTKAPVVPRSPQIARSKAPAWTADRNTFFLTQTLLLPSNCFCICSLEASAEAVRFQDSSFFDFLRTSCQ
jgi:hypothetical protein